MWLEQKVGNTKCCESHWMYLSSSFISMSFSTSNSRITQNGLKFVCQNDRMFVNLKSLLPMKFQLIFSRVFIGFFCKFDFIESKPVMFHFFFCIFVWKCKLFNDNVRNLIHYLCIYWVKFIFDHLISFT